MSAIRRGNIEVRLHEDGTLDEVVFYSSDGKPIFHMEQMDDNLFWMRFEGSEEDLVVNLGAVIGERHELTGERGTNGPVIQATFEWED